MGTSEVLKVLEANSYLTIPEIAEIADKTKQSVSRIIRTLTKDVSENLCFRELTVDEKKERYGWAVCSKIQIYWLEK